jgi:hypothetical protein
MFLHQRGDSPRSPSKIRRIFSFVAGFATTPPHPIDKSNFHTERRFVMGRKQNDEHLDQIRQAIQENDGQKAGAIGRMLGIDNKTIARALTQLEDRGDLLYEDDDGKIGWFGKRRE